MNDLLILALSKIVALFPLSNKPNFVISLGTSEPHYTNIPEKVSNNTQQKSILCKLGEAF